MRQSTLAQIALIVAIWALSLLPVHYWRLPLPAGLVGMIALLVLLSTRTLRPSSMARGSRWLLGQMLLFFVPAVMVVVDMPELIGPLGLKLMVATLVGTALVMLATAAVVHWALRRMGTNER